MKFDRRESRVVVVTGRSGQRTATCLESSGRFLWLGQIASSTSTIAREDKRSEESQYALLDKTQRWLQNDERSVHVNVITGRALRAFVAIAQSLEASKPLWERIPVVPGESGKPLVPCHFPTLSQPTISSMKHDSGIFPAR